MTNDQFLKRLPDRPIAFHRDFVRLTFVNESGKTEKIGVKGALMLSQAVYWSKRTKDPDGWFWKTQDQWEEETGLTSKEQETLNRKLMLSGLMKIKKEGIPSKNFYQVQTQKLVEAIFSIEDISSDDQKGSLETNNFQSPPKGVTGHPQRGSHSITEITAETTFLPTTPLVNILVVDDTKNADFVPCGPKCASAPQKCLWHNVATYIKTSDLNILLDLDAPYLLWLVEKTRVDDYSIKVIAKKAHEWLLTNKKKQKDVLTFLKNWIEKEKEWKKVPFMTDDGGNIFPEGEYSGGGLTTIITGFGKNRVELTYTRREIEEKERLEKEERDRRFKLFAEGKMVSLHEDIT